MKKIVCPTCKKYLNEHDKRQTNLCLEKFINVSTNPVVYSSTKKIICPTCKKDMLEHNQYQAMECVNKFIKQVREDSD
jgi:uncharacterized protein YbaR (Trm112 family)